MNTIRIIKIVFSDIIFPIISKNEEIGIDEDNANENSRIFKPYLQIFKHSEILFNSLLSEKELKTYRNTDISLWFNLDIDVNYIKYFFFF